MRPGQFYTESGGRGQRPATSAVRLIALTAYGQDEDRRRAKEVGFDEHLAKQADPVELAALITAG
ncbi:MAG TPA: hypothetical protein VM533_19930 [Fimbriiglobus sp.]|nr:hypothetical protein [Fimbriiglobus sp.]